MTFGQLRKFCTAPFPVSEAQLPARRKVPARRYRAPLTAIATGLLVCACGQKGPLFLPGDRSQVQTELPPLDRGSLEGTLEKDDDDAAAEVPDSARPPLEDDGAEPFIDPASPHPRSDIDRDEH